MNVFHTTPGGCTIPQSLNPDPSYLHHQQSDRTRAVWTDSTSTRQYRMLPGVFESTESRAAFARLPLELTASPSARVVHAPDDITVAEVLLAYLEHAQQHYRGADGKPTGKIQPIKTGS